MLVIAYSDQYAVYSDVLPWKQIEDEVYFETSHFLIKTQERIQVLGLPLEDSYSQILSQNSWVLQVNLASMYTNQVVYFYMCFLTALLLFTIPVYKFPGTLSWGCVK